MAVTGPPPKDLDFKTRVIVGSRSPLCSVAFRWNMHCRDLETLRAA
jgi:hypothetical protein